MMNKSTADTKTANWNVLTTKEQAKKVIQASEKKPQLVYKHSYRCSICIVAKEQLDDSFGAMAAKAGMNMINVVEAREVSNFLATQLDVRHESPQLLIIKDGKLAYDASHHSINIDDILSTLDNLA